MDITAGRHECYGYGGNHINVCDSGSKDTAGLILTYDSAEEATFVYMH